MEWIFGHHAVERVLENDTRPVKNLLVTAKNKDKYAPLAQKAAVKVQVVDRKVLDKKTSQPHQGVAAQVDKRKSQSLDSLMDEADLFILLDQVTDPHNVGAIVRSANAMGAAAVIVPNRHSAKDSPIIAKAAAGAMEDTPIIEEGNLANAIEKLKNNNFWIVGLAGDTDQTMQNVDLGGKIALVMGSEGSGLRRLIRDKCDFVAKLPMVGTVESLNVSVATGMALYEVRRQRGGK